MAQLDAFNQNPELFDIVDLDKYFQSGGAPNMQRPGLSITSSFIYSSARHPEDVVMNREHHEQRYLTQSSLSPNQEVSSSFAPYFEGSEQEGISVEQDFVGNAYQTERYPSEKLTPVKGEFEEGLKKPYKAEVIKTRTEKRPPVPNDNQLYPASSFTDGGTDTIDDYLVELTGPRTKTLQRRTGEVRQGSLQLDIDISAVIIGEPHVQRFKGVQLDKTAVLAPVLYCYGS